MEVTLLVSAFLAGLVMFFAPCTLPILPAYLGFISGVTASELQQKGAGTIVRRKVFRNGVGFVFGFALIFTLLGLLAGTLGSYIGQYRPYLEVVAALLVIAFGLFMLGVVQWSVFTKERRFRTPSWLSVGSTKSAALLGGAFAFGWTPCIGPILATVLLFAGSTETALSGAVLLVLFSLGFSIPFLILAALISEASRFVTVLLPVASWITKVSGVLLVVLGVFMLLGDMNMLTGWVFDLMDGLDYEEAILRYL